MATHGLRGQISGVTRARSRNVAFAGVPSTSAQRPSESCDERWCVQKVALGGVPIVSP